MAFDPRFADFHDVVRVDGAPIVGVSAWGAEDVEESYREFEHPRGRGGEWIRKGFTSRLAPVSPRDPRPTQYGEMRVTEVRPGDSIAMIPPDGHLITLGKVKDAARVSIQDLKDHWAAPERFPVPKPMRDAGVTDWEDVRQLEPWDPSKGQHAVVMVFEEPIVSRNMQTGEESSAQVYLAPYSTHVWVGPVISEGHGRRERVESDGARAIVRGGVMSGLNQIEALKPQPEAPTAVVATVNRLKVAAHGTRVGVQAALDAHEWPSLHGHRLLAETGSTRSAADPDSLHDPWGFLDITPGGHPWKLVTSADSSLPDGAQLMTATHEMGHALDAALAIPMYESIVPRDFVPGEDTEGGSEGDPLGLRHLLSMSSANRMASNLYASPLVKTPPKIRKAWDGFFEAAATPHVVEQISRMADGDHKSYVLSRHEIFARAYQQWILKGRPDLEAMDTIQASSARNPFWPDEEWAPVASALEGVLEAYGLKVGRVREHALAEAAEETIGDPIPWDALGPDGEPLPPVDVDEVAGDDDVTEAAWDPFKHPRRRDGTFANVMHSITALRGDPLVHTEPRSLEADGGLSDRERMWKTSVDTGLRWSRALLDVSSPESHLATSPKKWWSPIIDYDNQWFSEPHLKDATAYCKSRPGAASLYFRSEPGGSTMSTAGFVVAAHEMGHLVDAILAGWDPRAPSHEAGYYDMNTAAKRERRAKGLYASTASTLRMTQGDKIEAERERELTGEVAHERTDAAWRAFAKAVKADRPRMEKLLDEHVALAEENTLAERGERPTLVEMARFRERRERYWFDMREAWARAFAQWVTENAIAAGEQVAKTSWADFQFPGNQVPQYAPDNGWPEIRKALEGVLRAYGVLRDDAPVQEAAEGVLEKLSREPKRGRHTTIAPGRRLYVRHLEPADVAGSTAKLIDSLSRYARHREATLSNTIVDVMRSRWPNRPARELRDLVEEEAARERAFHGKQKTRLERDLPRALTIADAEARRRRVGEILSRERYWIDQRQQAMTRRAVSAADRADLRDQSPLGAVWHLGQAEKHTPDCIAMAGKVWPWNVLDKFHPPLHAGCKCGLEGIPSAITRGAISHDDIPKKRDAMRRAQQIMRTLREGRQVDSVEWAPMIDGVAEQVEDLAEGLSAMPASVRRVLVEEARIELAVALARVEEVEAGLDRLEAVEAVEDELVETADQVTALIERGMLDPVLVEENGLRTRDDIEELRSIGMLRDLAEYLLDHPDDLAEAFGLVRSFNPKLHLHGRDGRFMDMPDRPMALHPSGPGAAGAASRVPAPSAPHAPHTPSASPAVRAAKAAERPAAAASSATKAAEPPKTYEARRDALERRVGDLVSGVGTRAQIRARGGSTASGMKGSAGPTFRPEQLNDADAHFNAAGKVSQRTLLDYVGAAASKPMTVEIHGRTAADGSVVFHPSRKVLHDKIIDSFLRKRNPDGALDPGGAYLAKRADGKPRVLFTGGGYAAGKGGVKKRLAAQGVYDPQNTLVLDPDEIKSLLPEFQANLEHDPEANLHVYKEAWLISQEIQRQAQEKGLDVLVDGISNTDAQEMIDRVKGFTDRGYDAKVVYTDIPTEEAIKRAENRARNAKDASDKRYIPNVIMRSVHRDVAATIPELAARVQKDGIPMAMEVWDNNQPDRNPKRYFTLDPGASAKVEDYALWEALHAKAQETIPGVDAPGDAARPPDAELAAATA